MPAAAIILVLIAAVTHVAWNALGKRQNPAAAFFVWAVLWGLLLLSPLLVYFRDTLVRLPAGVWWFVFFTGFWQALYYGMLAAAYRKGDMSLAYPLLRAIPVLLLAALSFALGRGAELSPACLAGMALIFLGSVVLPNRAWREFHLRNYLNACCLCAFFAAVGTAGYSLIDHAALKSLRALPEAPLTPLDAALLYAPLEACSSLIWLGLYTLCVPYERRQLLEVWREGKARSALMGFGIFFAYTLVLAAMTLVQNVGYIVAFRQTSIPLGAAFGVLVLKEPNYFLKNAGVLAVFVGVILVAAG